MLHTYVHLCAPYVNISLCAHLNSNREVTFGFYWSIYLSMLSTDVVVSVVDVMYTIPFNMLPCQQQFQAIKNKSRSNNVLLKMQQNRIWT